MKKLLMITALLVVFLFPLATPSFADPCGPANLCTGADDVCTALGCIPTDPQGLIAWLLKNIVGLAGIIAFIFIVFGAFQVITSGGNPESTKKGSEMITSAIQGLLFIIFSLFILKLIGVDILAIPGFTP